MGHELDVLFKSRYALCFHRQIQTSRDVAVHAESLRVGGGTPNLVHSVAVTSKTSSRCVAMFIGVVQNAVSKNVKCLYNV